MTYDREVGDPVVVVVISYGGPQDVVNCLTGLSRSDFQTFELVLVENAGTAAFAALVGALDASGMGSCRARESIANAALPNAAARRSYRTRLPGGQPVVALEARENLGYGGGVNLALRCLAERATWRGVWVLNPDTYPDPSALGNVVKHAEGSAYGLVGCRLVFADQDRVQLRGGGEWHWLTGRAVNIGYREHVNQPADTAAVESRLHWISGAALYATKEYVTAIGPMNEDYFLYCEDVEWSLRRGKFRLGYAHGAVVRHAHGTTIGSSSDKGSRSNLSVYLNQRNTLLLTRDRAPALYPLAVLTTLLWVVDLLVRGNRRVFIAGCRGWWAGVRGKTGRPPEWIGLPQPRP